jgi:hypothetical protein
MRDKAVGRRRTWEEISEDEEQEVAEAAAAAEAAEARRARLRRLAAPGASVIHVAAVAQSMDESADLAEHFDSHSRQVAKQHSKHIEMLLRPGVATTSPCEVVRCSLSPRPDCDPDANLQATGWGAAKEKREKEKEK